MHILATQFNDMRILIDYIIYQLMSSMCTMYNVQLNTMCDVHKLLAQYFPND